MAYPRPRNGWRVRELLYKEQEGRCVWCGKAMERRDATLEHLMPRALGGTHRKHNLALSHEACNARRGTRVKEPYLWKIPECEVRRSLATLSRGKAKKNVRGRADQIRYLARRMRIMEEG